MKLSHEETARRIRFTLLERERRAVSLLSDAHRQAKAGFTQLAANAAKQALADLEDVLSAKAALRAAEGARR